MSMTRSLLSATPARRALRLPLAGLTLCASLLLTACPDKQEANQNPTIALQPTQSELTFTVGESVLITVYADDPDQDALTMSYEAKSANMLSTLNTAMWFPSAQMSTFSWTPDSADVTGDSPIELIFIVKDARGGYVDRKILVNILPGNGKPRFEGSSNELYKECCDKPLNLEIRVRDDDSSNVNLTMKEGPAGADFSPIGKDGSISRGRFTWKPSGALAMQRVHTAVFIADDGENPPVEQRLTIIIPPDDDFGVDVTKTDALSNVCKGDPLIAYTKLVEGRQSTQDQNKGTVLIEAALTDKGKATYDDLFLVWEYRDPLTNAEDDPTEPGMAGSEDNSQIKRVVDEQTGKMTWTVEYELLFDQDQQPFFYRVCAFDKDLDADDPNQIVCSPAGQPMYHSFRSYRDASQACVEEASEDFTGGSNDTFEEAKLAPSKWERHYACSGDPDFFTIEVKPGAKLKPIVVYSPEQQVEVKLYDKDRKEISSQLQKPACGGFVTAELSTPMSATSSQLYYLEVNGDDITYHTQVVALSKASEDVCVDDAAEPNDTVRDATPLALGGATPKPFEICPDGEDLDIYSFDLQAGQKLDLLMKFSSGGANIADMTIFSPGQKDEVGKASIGSGYTFANGTPDEPLSYEARQCGTHYLLVFSADSTTTGGYTLESTLGAASCMDADEFAGTCNHDLGSAQLFAPNKTYSLEVCGKGEDWFKRSKNGGVEFLAEVAVKSGDPSQVSFELYDADGMKITEGVDDGQGRLSFGYTFPDDDLYYFRVAAREDVTYELLLAQ